MCYCCSLWQKGFALQFPPALLLKSSSTIFKAWLKSTFSPPSLSTALPLTKMQTALLLPNPRGTWHILKTEHTVTLYFRMTHACHVSWWINSSWPGSTSDVFGVSFQFVPCNSHWLHSCWLQEFPLYFPYSDLGIPECMDVSISFSVLNSDPKQKFRWWHYRIFIY